MKQKITKKKNLTKKMLVAAMLLGICTFTNSVMAQTWNIGNPDYNSNVKATLSGNTLTISGSGNMCDFWVSGAGEAPWHSNTTYLNAIRNVVFAAGSSVTNIGQRAFKDCGNLQTITIPSSVAKINAQAFYGCSSLTTVTIENGNQELTFSRYNNTTDPEFPKGYIYDWFTGCNIQTLQLGRNYTGEGSTQPFRGISSLQNLTIGSTVTTIGNSAFADCNLLKTVRFEDGTNTLTLTTSRLSLLTFGNSPIETLHIGRPLTISNTSYQPFAGKTTIKTVTISRVFTDGTLNAGLFQNCTGLTSVTFPTSGLTTIGSSVFSGCKTLPAITIPNTVTAIGDDAFYGCETLSSISIPSTVSTIGTGAFSNCNLLKNVRFEDGTNTLTLTTSSGVLTFANSPIETLYINRPLTISSTSNQPFRNKTTLRTLTFGENVSSIVSDMFSGCTELTEIHSQKPTPPTAGTNCFYNVNKTTCKLYIPSCSNADAYRAVAAWNFNNIYAEGSTTPCAIGTGIDNVVANQLKIFPNPARTDLFIKSDLLIKKVEIYSLTGTLLILQNNFNEKISVSALSQGVYLLKIYTDKGVAVSKVIKE